MKEMIAELNKMREIEMNCVKSFTVRWDYLSRTERPMPNYGRVHYFVYSGKVDAHYEEWTMDEDFAVYMVLFNEKREIVNYRLITEKGVWGKDIIRQIEEDAFEQERNRRW